ncbi:MAG: hypothetical protein AB7K68_10960 [Bacteriovoracia bacterium]
MQNYRKILFTALVIFAGILSLFSLRATAENKGMAYGACYTLYNCQGGSIGTFDDTQCRAYGGHSINSGGVCVNL